MHARVCVCVSERNPVTVTLKFSFSPLDLKVFSAHSKMYKFWTLKSMKKMIQSTDGGRGHTQRARMFFLFFFDGGNVVW